MKSNKIIKGVTIGLVGLYLLFLILGVLVPILSIESGSGSEPYRLFFFDVFAGVSSSGSSGTTTTPSYFQGVLIISICVMGALFVCLDNKLTKVIGSSFLLTSFGVLIYVFNSVLIAKKAIRVTTGTVSIAGSVLFLIAAILAIIICLMVLLDCSFSSLTKLLKPKMTLEERIKQIELLKQQGLISEQEAASMKKEALK